MHNFEAVYHIFQVLKCYNLSIQIHIERIEMEK